MTPYSTQYEKHPIEIATNGAVVSLVGQCKLLDFGGAIHCWVGQHADRSVRIGVAWLGHCLDTPQKNYNIFILPFVTSVTVNLFVLDIYIPYYY